MFDGHDVVSWSENKRGGQLAARILVQVMLSQEAQHSSLSPTDYHHQGESLFSSLLRLVRNKYPNTAIKLVP